MSTCFARLLLPLLLLAQVGVGMSPGRVLCIASERCDGATADHAHDHAHDHHAHGQHAHGAHRHPAGCATDHALSAQSDCDCHIHLSLPDDAGASRDRSGDRIADVRLMALAILAPMSLDRMHAPHRTGPWTRAAFLAATDQCCARETTRLLI